MALTYFPFDAGAGANVTEDQWRKMARHWLGTGVLADEDDEFAVAESSPNAMTVDVAAGKAWIRGHYLESDDVEVKTISAADLTNDRIDRIVLRVDFGNNTISVEVLEGTPAATPAVPALTQNAATWEISIAQVAVGTAVSSITDADITDERIYARSGGEPPAGAMLDFGGTTAPTGYLLCDGSAVARDHYSDLFDAIGTTHGVGDGSTTFNLPDARGRTTVGVGTHADVNAVGDNDGEATVANRRPKHGHPGVKSYLYQYDGAELVLAIDATGGTNISARAASPAVGPTAAGTPQDAPSYLVVNKIIKT